ncbi:MAG TPA: class A beta-lactamase-related serine hydrolase, partial [Gemmatimonadetes bacterium]|nr:class A beta-lactamase-related serine hydrolase [Gemmatimonadota bacterium]
MSVSLVDDQDMVWAAGFGMQDPDAGIPATEKTVYRVGSVSKLFTDIAIMQLVERGELDLDAPVSTYLQDFAPENPFGREITLRQLTSHRSGLVREPPVGHYFDPTEPSLSQTVASLSSTSLVYPPTERIKYSNAAIATGGVIIDISPKYKT